MVFTDRYNHQIDLKNRLAIPSQIRSAMDLQVDGSAFYLVPEGRYLQLLPEKLFMKLAAPAQTGLSTTPEIAKARRMVFASASRLEPDAQGRVIIPDRFMRDAKRPDPFTEAILEREVTLVGANDRVELWNRADFEGHMRELFADRGSLQPTMEKLFSLPPVANPGSN